MGCYFVFFRPALLPEDLSYIGTSEVEVNRQLPGLTRWLHKVFIVLGGYIITAGSLMIYLGIAENNRNSAALNSATLISGLTSIVTMTVINFIIDSDFKWILLLLTTPWVFSLFTYFKPIASRIS